jgi:hypothetical protein
MTSVAELWARLREAYSGRHLSAENARAYDTAEASFLASGPERLEILSKALLSADRHLGITVCERLSPVDLTSMFDALVFYASWDNGLVGMARRLIKAMPRQWVLERIEAAAEPYLAEGGEQYRRFLELYEELSDALTRKLAERALAHSDPTVQEAGQDAMDWIRER